MTEICLRSDFDAIGAVAEVNGVEVALEDLRLRQLIVDLDRKDGFLELAGDRPFLSQVENLDVLLGDGRGSFGRIARGVVSRGAQDAFQVDPAVRIERAVLGGDNGGLHRGRNLVHTDALAVLRREVADLVLAVGVIDICRLRLEIRVHVRNADEPVKREKRHRTGDDSGDTEEDDPAQGTPPERQIAAIDLAYTP